MIGKRLFPFLATAALAGCVTPREGQLPEFVGHPLSVEAASGQVSTLLLHPDGTFEARYDGKTREARWDFRDGKLCYAWTETYRECWPHTAPFRRGRTETIRSDHGNVVKVTME
jgi:hypothetical protein